jgi:hypothetical protein
MEQRQGNNIKQGTAYVFMLHIPHIPDHSSAGLGYSNGIAKIEQSFSFANSKRNEERGARKSLSVLPPSKKPQSPTCSDQEQDDGAADPRGGRTFATGVQDVLEGILDHITQPTWLQDFAPERREKLDHPPSTNIAAGHIVIFTTQYVDLVLNRLKRFGVGTADHGTMTIFPSSLQYGSGPQMGVLPGDDKRLIHTDNSGDNNMHVDGTNFVSNFLNSVNSRVVVEEVIGNVRAGAIFSFDYLLLVIVASMIAAVGLGSNNVVAIVASMLVSPIVSKIIHECLSILVLTFVLLLYFTALACAACILHV